MAKFKWLLPLVAILLVAAGVFAMNNRSSNSKTTTYYYHYKGSATTLSEYQKLENWEASTQEGPGCAGSGKPCVVRSNYNAVNTFVSNISNTSDVDNNIELEKS